MHNFIIDMDVPPTILNEEEDDKIVPMENGPQEMGYLPTMLEDEDEKLEKLMACLKLELQSWMRSKDKELGDRTSMFKEILLKQTNQ